MNWNIMDSREIERFAQTFDALEPRRKVYVHPVDKTDQLIAMIKECIKAGNDRVCDLTRHIRERQGVSKTTLLEILNNNMDDLWYVVKGVKTTKHYRLTEKGEEE